MTPTKSDSERLARANLGNIAKKLSAGKTLTTAERKAERADAGAGSSK